MKTKLIIAIFGIAVTTHANAIPCGPEATSFLGYSGYQSTYISHSYLNRCNNMKYMYFFKTSSSSTDASNLCPSEHTKTLTLTEYIIDPDSSIASNNARLGSVDSIYYYETCITCKSGYTQVLLARIDDEDTGAFYDIYGCGTCQGENWTTSESSYAIENRKVCYTADGSPTTEYRCAAGFYGTGANGNSSNCSKCPPVSGPTGPSCWGTSDAGYNTDITDCYLTPGTCTDMTGTFKINDYCDYTK